MVNDKLPNLFVIGAAKAGTTAFCDTLSSCGDIFVPVVKEPHYFYSNTSFGRSAKLLDQRKEKKFISSKYSIYSSLKNYLDLYVNSKAVYRCDGSTQYFTNNEAIKNIHRESGGAKYIVILRNPVKRAWSAYTYACSKGEEYLSFNDALACEISGERDEFFYGGYLNTSQYGTHLKNLLSVVDRKSVHVVIFEEFIENQNACLAEVIKFLNLDNVSPDSFKSNILSNQTLIPKSKLILKIRSKLKDIRQFEKLFVLFPFLKNFILFALSFFSTLPPKITLEDQEFLKDKLQKDSEILYSTGLVSKEILVLKL
jgi:hypothetical protein